MPADTPADADLIVIGAGAAGLATAIFAARNKPGARVRCLDGARVVGAKILISGGSRCNVTNRRVNERDFWGGPSRTIASVLRAFPAERAAAFFDQLGVGLREEEDGKLFPTTNRSRTVLDALLGEAARVGVAIETAQRVHDIRWQEDRFVIATTEGPHTAPFVVLATGGRSLPKSGSDGYGYELAARLGHGQVATTPALVPLVFDGYADLAGVAHPAAMSLKIDGRVITRLDGPMLWTHFGASGPLVLNMSRHWHRARVEGVAAEVAVHLLPEERFESLERWWLAQERSRPRARVSTVLATRLPLAVAERWTAAAGIAVDTTLAHLERDRRRALVHAVLDTVLPVRDSRGYQYAEVTAGGIPLQEIDPVTMESRVRPQLFLVGEILDVDGRLGGFNFQWAWSSGWVAGRAIAERLRSRTSPSHGVTTA